MTDKFSCTNKDGRVKEWKHNKKMRLLTQANQSSIFKTVPSAQASASVSAYSIVSSNSSSTAVDMTQTVPAQHATQPNQQQKPVILLKRLLNFMSVCFNILTLLCCACFFMSAIFSRFFGADAFISR